MLGQRGLGAVKMLKTEYFKSSLVAKIVQPCCLISTQYVVIKHLSEQVNYIELKTEQYTICIKDVQVSVKSHGQPTYLQKQTHKKQ